MTVEEFISEMRRFETDHETGGYPAVKMKDISELCDIIERLAGNRRHDYFRDSVDVRTKEVYG